MKTPTAPSRIVSVATNIAATQKRRTEIAKRKDVLSSEMNKLNDEDANLSVCQHNLQREMDKLASPTSIQP